MFISNKMDLDIPEESWFRSIPESLKLFYPIRMLLRLYATCILCWDISWLIIYSLYSILRSFYHFVVPPKMKSVSGETVLIVGSCRGVGREIAKQMARLGSKVICVDINESCNKFVTEEAQNLSPHDSKSVWYFTCDVTKQAEVLKLAETVRSQVGVVTMLFHCCGIPSPRSLISQETPDIHKTLDLTVNSHFWLLEAFLPDMKKHNNGHIVALTSVAGLSGQKDQLPVSVAQFAVQGLAESVLEELRISKSENVHVTIVHIYPFIISADLASDIRLRIPSYFGTIDARIAARSIIEAVRRNCIEVSIPRHLIFIGHLLRILPRQATVMMRDLLDTGVDFG